MESPYLHFPIDSRSCESPGPRLTTRNPSPHLIAEISEACTIQKELESSDHRTPTRYVFRTLKKSIKTDRIHGLTAVAAPGFFGNASRDQRAIWGDKKDTDTVIYIWDSMEPTDQDLKTPSKTSERLEQASFGKNGTMNGSPHSTRQDSPRSPSRKERNPKPKELEQKDGGTPENSEQA